VELRLQCLTEDARDLCAGPLAAGVRNPRRILLERAQQFVGLGSVDVEPAVVDEGEEAGEIHSTEALTFGSR
jgi:hypothetical protein